MVPRLARAGLSGRSLVVRVREDQTSPVTVVQLVRVEPRGCQPKVSFCGAS